MSSPAVAAARHPGASCTDSWVNTAGGDWSTASDWSKGTVPSTSDNACITAAGTYTVTMNDGSQTAYSGLLGSHGTVWVRSTGAKLVRAA